MLHQRRFSMNEDPHPNRTEGIRQIRELRNYPMGLMYLTSFIEHFPKDAEAWRWIGICQIETGKNPETALIRAGELDENDPWPHYHLGKWYWSEGRLQDAINQFETTSSLADWGENHLDEVEIWRAWIYEAMGDYQQAARAYDAYAGRSGKSYIRGRGKESWQERRKFDRLLKRFSEGKSAENTEAASRVFREQFAVMIRGGGLAQLNEAQRNVFVLLNFLNDVKHGWGFGLENLRYCSLEELQDSFQHAGLNKWTKILGEFKEWLPDGMGTASNFATIFKPVRWKPEGKLWVEKLDSKWRKAKMERRIAKARNSVLQKVQNNPGAYKLPEPISKPD